MTTIELKSNSPAETLAIGRRLAGLLQAGDVVLLSGRLGSGKTLFASGVAEGLGVSDPVTSPSFVLVREYDGFLPVVHADAYRLGSVGELDDLQLPETSTDGVLMVEWGNAVSSSLPEDRVEVEIEIRSEETRMIRVRPRGSWRDRPIDELVV